MIPKVDFSLTPRVRGPQSIITVFFQHEKQEENVSSSHTSSALISHLLPLPTAPMAIPFLFFLFFFEKETHPLSIQVPCQISLHPKLAIRGHKSPNAIAMTPTQDIAYYMKTDLARTLQPFACHSGTPGFISTLISSSSTDHKLQNFADSFI